MSAAARYVKIATTEVLKFARSGREWRSSAETSEQMEAIRPHFDESFYIHQHPALAASALDTVAHFCTHGWKEGRNPNPLFSVDHYLEANPDVREAGINPFWHYLMFGRAEGRTTVPAANRTTQKADGGAVCGFEREAEAIRIDFDPAFYLRHNPDVDAAEIDPLLHFVRLGWREHRDPNADFSVSYYLDANPDVRSAGINPFWHYIVAGKSEGRAARHPGGAKAEALIDLEPFEKTAEKWTRRSTPETLLSSDDLLGCLLLPPVKAATALVIALGHDNYREVSGGVQYCIQHEEEIAKGRGIAYLNVHPYQPLPRLAHSEQDPDILVSLLFDGVSLGVAAMSAVIDATRKLDCRFTNIDVVIHHLLGHSTEQIVELVKASGVHRAHLWIHDFFTLCPNYTLQRNNVSFCGAPPETSNSCNLCLYGAERLRHLPRIAALFDALEVHVVAPSKFAAEFWTAHTQLSAASLTILPHATLDWTASNGRSQENQRLTVAFVGYPAAHKGWSAFQRVVRSFRGAESDFDFVYFGTSSIGLDQVESVRVHVTAADPDAMVRALAERKVDIVLHWATCAETFSFSTHEALAAGAYVVTNAASGNVAATVRELGRGAVLSDEADLEAFFRDGRAAAMVAELRARRQHEKATLIRNESTVGILEQGRSR